MVIAIMAVLTGIASMSLASVMGVSVKQCARDIQSAANQTRVSTLGKDEVIMTITKGNKAKSSEAYYCTIVTKDGLGKTTENEEKIGKSNLFFILILMLAILQQKKISETRLVLSLIPTKKSTV